MGSRCAILPDALLTRKRRFPSSVFVESGSLLLPPFQAAHPTLVFSAPSVQQVKAVKVGSRVGMIRVARLPPFLTTVTPQSEFDGIFQAGPVAGPRLSVIAGYGILATYKALPLGIESEMSMSANK